MNSLKIHRVAASNTLKAYWFLIQAYLSGINPEWIKKSRLVKSTSSILYLVSAFLLKKEAVSKEKEAISKGKEAVPKGKKSCF